MLGLSKQITQVTAEINLIQNNVRPFTNSCSNSPQKAFLHNYLFTKLDRNVVDCTCNVFLSFFYFFFKKRKPFFCLSLNFLNIMLQIRLRFSKYFLLNFYLFVIFVYLVRFNTNNKSHFQTYMSTHVPNRTKHGGTTINNKNRKEF